MELKSNDTREKIRLVREFVYSIRSLTDTQGWFEHFANEGDNDFTHLRYGGPFDELKTMASKVADLAERERTLYDQFEKSMFTGEYDIVTGEEWLNRIAKRVRERDGIPEGGDVYIKEDDIEEESRLLELEREALRGEGFDYSIPLGFLTEIVHLQASVYNNTQYKETLVAAEEMVRRIDTAYPPLPDELLEDENHIRRLQEGEIGCMRDGFEIISDWFSKFSTELPKLLQEYPGNELDDLKPKGKTDED